MDDDQDPNLKSYIIHSATDHFWVGVCFPGYISPFVFPSSGSHHFFGGSDCDCDFVYCFQ